MFEIGPHPVNVLVDMKLAKRSNTTRSAPLAGNATATR
jgi:hypothetical protein